MNVKLLSSTAWDMVKSFKKRYCSPSLSGEALTNQFPLIASFKKDSALEYFKMVPFLLPVLGESTGFCSRIFSPASPIYSLLSFAILGAGVCLCPLLSYEYKESCQFFRLFRFHLLGWSGNFQAPMCGTRSQKYTPPILHITSPPGRILAPSQPAGLGETSGTSPSHPEETLKAEGPPPALFLGKGRETDI